MWFGEPIDRPYDSTTETIKRRVWYVLASSYYLPSSERHASCIQIRDHRIYPANGKALANSGQIDAFSSELYVDRKKLAVFLIAS